MLLRKIGLYLEDIFNRDSNSNSNHIAHITARYIYIAESRNPRDSGSLTSALPIDESSNLTKSQNVTYENETFCLELRRIEELLDVMLAPGIYDEKKLSHAGALNGVVRRLRQQ